MVIQGVRNERGMAGKSPPSALYVHLSPSTDPPTVTITSRVIPGGNRIFKCLAYGFYPQRISLHWNKANKKLAFEPERGVFPNGNGTYLSWAEVEVSPQDIDPFFCLIDHRGFSQSLSVQWDRTRKVKDENNVVAQPQ
jgi:hypothetical protein